MHLDETLAQKQPSYLSFTTQNYGKSVILGSRSAIGGDAGVAYPTWRANAWYLPSF